MSSISRAAMLELWTLNILRRDRNLLVYRIQIQMMLLTIGTMLPTWRERLTLKVHPRLVIILDHCISLLVRRLFHLLNLITLRIITRLILELLSLWPISMVILTLRSLTCSLITRILRPKYICTLWSSWLSHIHGRSLITRLHSRLSPVLYIAGWNALWKSRRRSLSMKLMPHAKCRGSLSVNWLLRYFAIRVILNLSHVLHWIRSWI